MAVLQTASVAKGAVMAQNLNPITAVAVVAAVVAAAVAVAAAVEAVVVTNVDDNNGIVALHLEMAHRTVAAVAVAVVAVVAAAVAVAVAVVAAVAVRTAAIDTGF